MNDPSRLFTELMSNWAKAQNEAWQAQSDLLRGAGAAFADAATTKPAATGASPIDDAWTRSQEAFEAWKRFADTAMPGTAEGGFGADMLAHLMDPGAWANIGINELNQTIEHLAEGIQFADLWHKEREILGASREWLDLRRHSLRYRQIIIAAWMRAFETFSDRFAKDMAVDGTRLPDWKAMTGAWLDVANEELLKTQRSEEFLGAQRDLLRASIDFRTRQQRLVEEFCEANAMPTRSEVDDLHRTVTEMRRQLRALKRELATRRAASRPAKPAEAAAASAPRRKTKAPSRGPKS